jgi:hypothetical protein
VPPAGTKRGARRTVLLFGLAAFAFSSLLGAPLLAADSEPDSPAAQLFELPSNGACFSPSKWHRGDWKRVPEDTIEYEFKGVPFIANDKLAIVIERGQEDVKVFAFDPSRPKRSADSCRAFVRANRSSDGATVQGVRIIENSAAGVTLETQWKSRDGLASGTLAFRLTAGQPIIEVRPGGHVQQVSFRQGLSYAIVPDFFGDDMVFCPTFPKGSRRIGLPAENFFLSVTDRSDAMVMCAWPSNRQEADNFGGGHEVQCVVAKPIWLAFLEGAGVWHAGRSAGKPDDQIIAGWKIPFSAKWRADLLCPPFLPRSWYVDGPVPSFPTDLPQGQAGTVVESVLFAYPIDRDRQTPLDVFTPMDVLRNTLGVGPCQYILQTEGLGAEGNPTPDNVMTWVEKQFARKKQKNSADEIREMLARMGAQVTATQARIERYAAAARELRNMVGEKELMSAGATGMMSLHDTLAYLDRSLAEDGGTRAVERTHQLAAAVAALVDKANSADECRKLGAEARQVGLTQERTLARCRMALRWVRAQAKMAAADKPASGLAKTVQTRVEEVLYAK